MSWIWHLWVSLHTCLHTALAVSSHFLHCVFVARSLETKTMSLNFNFKLSLFKTVPDAAVIFQQRSTLQDARSSAALMLGWNVICLQLQVKLPHENQKRERLCCSYVSVNLTKMLDAFEFEDYVIHSLPHFQMTALEPDLTWTKMTCSSVRAFLSKKRETHYVSGIIPAINKSNTNKHRAKNITSALANLAVYFKSNRTFV